MADEDEVEAQPTRLSGGGNPLNILILQSFAPHPGFFGSQSPPLFEQIEAAEILFTPAGCSEDLAEGADRQGVAAVVVVEHRDHRVMATAGFSFTST